jgi:hypothetical protein
LWRMVLLLLLLLVLLLFHGNGSRRTRRFGGGWIRIRGFLWKQSLNFGRRCIKDLPSQFSIGRHDGMGLSPTGKSLTADKSTDIVVALTDNINGKSNTRVLPGSQRLCRQHPGPAIQSAKPNDNLLADMTELNDRIHHGVAAAAARTRPTDKAIVGFGSIFQTPSLQQFTTRVRMLIVNIQSQWNVQGSFPSL